MLVPAIPLLIAVPLYRVHQVPIVSPGFDPAPYEAEIKVNLAAGTVTADLYRRASDLMRSHPRYTEAADSASNWNEREFSRPPIQADQQWLRDNSAALALLLEASERPICMFGDPRKENNWPNFHDNQGAQWPPDLMLVSARQLEGEGKLDAALDRYFATLQVASHLGEVGGSDSFPELFRQFAYWGAQPGQTRERIGGALKRLQAIDPQILRLDECIKSDYILGHRMAFGNPAAMWRINRYFVDTDVLWLKLMPWESDRAVRVLNLLSQTALERLQEMRLALDRSAKGNIEYSDSGNIEGAVRNFCLDRNYYAIPNGFFETRLKSDWERAASKKAEWLETTVPDLRGMGYAGFEVANNLAAFETQRRAVMIVLALESYRLDHGELPNSLGELKGQYLAAVPLDPYSGMEFQYFRTGLPAPETEIDNNGFRRARHDELGWPGGPIEYGVPAVWSTGPQLVPATYLPTRPDGTAAENREKSQIIVGYSLGWGRAWRALSKSDAWEYGYWFGVPYNRSK